MKTMNLFAMFAAAACAVVVLGCWDRGGEGEYIFPQDVNADAFTADGSTDVEPDESPPPDGSEDDVKQDIGDDVPTAQEYCSGYVGTWDCVCTSGICTQGQHVYYVITLLQQGENVWTMWSMQIDGVEGPFTCDPNNPPPGDGSGWTVQLVTPNTMEQNVQDPDPSWCYTTSCTRLE